MLYELNKEEVEYLKSVLVDVRETAARYHSLDENADSIILSLGKPRTPPKPTKVRKLDFDCVYIAKGKNVIAQLEMVSPESPLDLK